MADRIAERKSQIAALLEVGVLVRTKGKTFEQACDMATVPVNTRSNAVARTKVEEVCRIYGSLQTFLTGDSPEQVRARDKYDMSVLERGNVALRIAKPIIPAAVKTGKRSDTSELDAKIAGFLADLENLG